MTHPARCRFALLTLLGLPATGAAAQPQGAVCANEEAALTAPDGAPDDQFGFAVSLSGTTAVVGAYLDDSPLMNAGAAHVFEGGAGAWSWTRRLVAPDAAATDRFGASVAIDTDTIAVAAPFDDDGASNAGSVYVYIRSGTEWTGQQKLVAADGGAGDLFGAAIALSGDTLLVGAPFHDHSLTDAGAAYVFVRSGTVWTQQAELRASDGAVMDGFGSKLDLDGDTAVIGVPSDDDAGTSSGSAYVFVRTGTTWTQQQKLTASDPDPVDTFGDAIAVEGDTALIGSPRDDDLGTDAGAAYVFVRSGSTWTQQVKLTAADGAAMDLFGLATALSGDTALLGARWDDDNGMQSGSASFFQRVGTTWLQGTKIVPADGAADDVFGNAVALTSAHALVGAFGKDALGSNSGGAYVFAHASGAASEVGFNGTPPNPAALLPGQTSGPLLGATWDPRIDHTSFFPGALADLLVVTPAPPLNVPTSFGTLLCSLAPPSDLFVTVAGTPFSIAIPSDCSFVGLAVCAQGGSFAPGPVIQLTDALALVLGTR